MFEPINESHILSGFDCGKPSLNNWLMQRALSNHDNGFTSVIVAPIDNKVIGYYGLSPTAVSPKLLPRSIRTGQPPDPMPCILLGRLAVDILQKGKGLGTALLHHALFRSVTAAKLVGGRALLVNALDEEAIAFWFHRGFTATNDDRFLMFIGMKEIERTLEGLRQLSRK